MAAKTDQQDIVNTTGFIVRDQEAAPAPRRVLTKSEILTRRAVKTQEVPTPEWGEGSVVLVRGMTGQERDAWEESLMDQDSKEARKAKRGLITLENQRARVVAKCVVDEDGRRLFNDYDVMELGLQDAAPLDRIYDVVMSMSGVNDKEPDDILGKFKEANSGASPTNTPAN